MKEPIEVAQVIYDLLTSGNVGVLLISAGLFLFSKLSKIYDFWERRKGNDVKYAVEVLNAVKGNAGKEKIHIDLLEKADFKRRWGFECNLLLQRELDRLSLEGVKTFNIKHASKLMDRTSSTISLNLGVKNLLKSYCWKVLGTLFMLGGFSMVLLTPESMKEWIVGNIVALVLIGYGVFFISLGWPYDAAKVIERHLQQSEVDLIDSELL
jgi:hypothetical protein